MILIHNYVDKIKNFNQKTIENIDNFLLYSGDLNTYTPFNNELLKHKKVLFAINEKLNTISPYSVSIKKIFDIGNVMSNFYNLYSNNLFNESSICSMNQDLISM